MTKNKIASIIIALVVCLVSFNTTYAVSIYDVDAVDGVYKVSEDNSTFDLPFLRVVQDRIEVDKPIEQTSILMSNSSIDVSEPIEGLQMLYSNDIIRLNSTADYPIIFSSTGVVIKGTIEKNTLIYSGGTVTIEEGANIKGTLLCYAPKLEINGEIDGNIIGTTSTLSINNVINGTVKMNVTEINFSENAVVEKGIELNTTNKNLVIPETVGESKVDYIEISPKISVGQYFINVFTAAISNVAIYLLLLIFVKKERIAKLSEKLTNGKTVIANGLKGYLALIISICFGIAMLPLLTGLGVSLIVFSIAAMIIFTLLKNVVVVTFITELVREKYNDQAVKPNAILTAIMSFLILELIYTIPYFGELVKFFVFIMALGFVLVLISKNKTQEKVENKEEKVETIEVK